MHEEIRRTKMRLAVLQADQVLADHAIRVWEAIDARIWNALLASHPLAAGAKDIRRSATALILDRHYPQSKGFYPAAVEGGLGHQRDGVSAQHWQLIFTAGGLWLVRPDSDEVVLLAQGYVATDAHDADALQALLTVASLLHFSDPVVAAKPGLVDSLLAVVNVEYRFSDFAFKKATLGPCWAATSKKWGTGLRASLAVPSLAIESERNGVHPFLWKSRAQRFHQPPGLHHGARCDSIKNTLILPKLVAEEVTGICRANELPKCILRGKDQAFQSRQRQAHGQPCGIEIEVRPDRLGAFKHQTERSFDLETWITTVYRQDVETFVVDPSGAGEPAETFEVFYDHDALGLN